MDLAIDEVTQIATIIQEEAGDDAEIIFGAVHDPSLEGQVRVTVIATGFDSEDGAVDQVLRPDFRRQAPAMPVVEPRAVEAQQRVAAAVGSSRGVVPFTRPPERVVTREQIGELDIPTFIRRQMD